MPWEPCLLSIERRAIATGNCFGCNSASQITRTVKLRHDILRAVSLETGSPTLSVSQLLSGSRKLPWLGKGSYPGSSKAVLLRHVALSVISCILWYTVTRCWSVCKRFPHFTGTLRS